MSAQGREGTLVDLHVVEAVDHTTVDAVLVRHRDGSIGHMSFETAIAAGIAAKAQIDANALAQIDPATTGAAVLP